MASPQSGEPVPESARYDLIPCPGDRCLTLSGAPGTPKYEKTCCNTCAGMGVVPAPDCPNPQWENALRYMRRPFSKREEKSISWDLESTMQATRRIWAQRRKRALDRLKRGTTERIVGIKARIRERDRDHCQICGIDVSDYEHLVTLGHKVDRFRGGSDSDINLEVECAQCNGLKPHHSSLDEYYEWRREFRSRMVLPYVDTPEPRSEPEGEAESWFARFWRGKRRAA